MTVFKKCQTCFHGFNVILRVYMATLLIFSFHINIMSFRFLCALAILLSFSFSFFFFLSFRVCVCVSFYSESTFTPFCFRHSTPNLQFLSNSIDAMGAVHIWTFLFPPHLTFALSSPSRLPFSQAVVSLLSSLLLNECVIITYHDFFFDSFYFSFVRSSPLTQLTHFHSNPCSYIYSIIICTKKKS